MIKRCYLLALVLGLLFVSGSGAQYPILDALADKVIQKYQQSSCEQLWERKGQPKSQKEQEAIQITRNDPGEARGIYQQSSGAHRQQDV